jgi:hypothetical protein
MSRKPKTVNFKWSNKLGDGHLPIASPIYDKIYYQKYVGYAKTKMGRRIKNFRCNFVSQFLNPKERLCDIGMGCGDFIDGMAKRGQSICGYDINPVGIKWLKESNLWWNPYEHQADGLSFWDSLEHIENIEAVISTSKKWVFISMPIYRNKKHCLLSRHFRPEEHCHYFTRSGLNRRMNSYGFELVGWSLGETIVGREDIESFAFRRSLVKTTVSGQC